MLPTGTVTFLFTDIEGSTRLWEQYPDAMHQALLQHDAILSEAVEAVGGYVVKKRGDGFHVAFDTATAAVRAATQAQIRLHRETWPPGITLRVRMGLHTGEAEWREGDYYGKSLNRAARLEGAAYGGQVLLSDATMELCRDALPPDVTLLPLGEHRLKDLSRPETVYQLRHPDLPDTFPPLRTLDNPLLKHNLPMQLSSFIGREKEIAEAIGHLSRTRLLTITGSGGCGKTRLALQVAADVLEDYPDGVWFVELAPIAEAALIPQTVAQALGVKERSGETILQTLIEYLQAKDLLLIFDNCEHLLSASVALMGSVLRACSRAKIIATSRERLNIAGELTFRVPSLTLPDPHQTVTASSLGQYEAVRLFIERALFHTPDFAIDNRTAPALAQLCFRLDGIPLAIELAAARTRSLSIEEINRRLDSRFRLLTGGDRSLLPRQQTLFALIDWSYGLLTEPEKVLFSRLSVFVGGWTIEAAERVCGFAPLEDWEILDLLTSLVDKSLVLAETHGETRYRMLETIRQYGVEKLTEHGESTELGERHRDWCIAWAEKYEPLLFGDGQTEALRNFNREQDNLRMGLAWCRTSAQGAEPALQLASHLARFWYMCGRYTEGKEFLEEAIGRARSRSAAMASALTGIARFLHYHLDFVTAREYLERSQQLNRERGDTPGLAITLLNMGANAGWRGDYPNAALLFEESLLLFREVGNDWGIAISLGNLGNVVRHRGRYDEARSLMMESMRICRERNDRSGMIITLSNLAGLAFDLGDLAEARQWQEEAMARSRELGVSEASLLKEYGRTIGLQGDLPKAKELVEEGVRLAAEAGDQLAKAEALAYLSEIARRQGDLETARRCLIEDLKAIRTKDVLELPALLLQEAGYVLLEVGQTEAAVCLWAAHQVLRDTMDWHLSPFDQTIHQSALERARALLGEAACHDAQEKGRQLSWQQAVAMALERLQEGQSL